MGHIFTFNDTLAYEQWFANPRNRRSVELENRFIMDMLNPMRGETVLDIGCGTGTRITPLIEKGLQVTGIDPSPYMLDIAMKNASNRADLHRGVAEDLPFEDNAFNYACLITTLEFVEDPDKALREASRIAKDRIFIGILNKCAVKGIQLRLKGIFTNTIYNHARFFSLWEMKQMARNILGNVPITWRSACHYQVRSAKITMALRNSYWMQRCPFGSFIGMVVTLVPRYKTKPLSLSYPAKRTTGVAPG